MRYSFVVGSALVALLLALVPSSAQDGKKKQIKPSQMFAGKKAENELADMAPKVGYLTSQKALENLWSGWQLKDKAPKIDFAKQIVFVQLAKGGPNVPHASYTLDDKGDLKALAISTLIGGPGFGYSIDVLDREGIKTYQGKAIVEEAGKK